MHVIHASMSCQVPLVVLVTVVSEVLSVNCDFNWLILAVQGSIFRGIGVG